ncbi:hypothetical protein DWF00_02295 [Bosea caraganae]|uniref:UPF0235 protein DWE98_18460 n=1 Tax=Bosea caraganae TaxID=2763117 RepID=A0A370L2H4_9HYPH|nr:DUF167 family protein [Bosea caraganae]RDJ22435.1 hypothetical protein DWE98_18460 [Bosea caraganae]RDJ30394.1 hypothetical protein DWF00_02295 [Bosea caraganae]
MPAWTATPDGLLLAVRLTPRGGRDAIDGVELLADRREVLKVRVRAAPTEGEANAALLALLAKLLGVPRSRTELAAGATARLKVVAVSGEAEALLARLKAQLPGT